MSTPRRHRLRRRTVWIAVGTVALVVAVGAVAVGAGTVSSFVRDRGPQPPAVGTRFVVLDESGAARAAGASTGAEHDAAQYLAAQPTAYWLTPERDPLEAVGNRVASLAGEAREKDAMLALVVYGLPERDCGNHSAGGLSEQDYPVWIAEIAAALNAAADVRAVVVLEPDSLSLAQQCGNLDARVTQLRTVVAALQRTGTWIYLDGGHSNWHPPADQAALLRAVGLDGVRGFSLNVSNFNWSYDEFDYARAVAQALGGDVHALIDTSRNGAGSNGEWCNPPGRLVGEASGTLGDGVVDTNLWVKPPGESDGPCNGGPPAGDWWPAAAIELSREARG